MRASQSTGDRPIQECRFAQNCVEVCPKGLPLAEARRDVLIQSTEDPWRRMKQALPFVPAYHDGASANHNAA